MKRIASILFAFLISTGIWMPNVIYFYGKYANQQAGCNEEFDQPSQSDKIKNNGDKFLLALLKRTCESNDKQKTNLPTAPVLVYVSQLTSDPVAETIPVFRKCTRRNFHYLNNYSFLEEHNIFHPPSAG